MKAQHWFSDIDPKNIRNEFKVTLFDGDAKDNKIIKTVKGFNAVGTSRLQLSNVGYKQWAAGTNYSGQFAGYIGATDVNLALLADTYGLSADSAYAKLYQYDSVGNLLPLGSADPANPRMTAFNYLNALTNSGTKGGIFLPALSGLQRYRSCKWTYEWGTTQGNGTIKALGYFPSNRYMSTANGIMFRTGIVPEMANTDNYTFAGYKTSGVDKHLYFAARAAISNNVVVVKASDLSLISQKTITNPTGLWSYSQKDITFTPVGGGQWYGIVSQQISTPGFTFKKGADGASITFGSNVAVTTSFPAGWTQMNFYSFCADESFIYALVYNQGNTESGILKFDPSTDTVVSVTKNPSGFGGVGGVGHSQLFNICPNTGKLITLWEDTIVEWPSITTPQQMVAIGSWENNKFLNTSSSKTFLYYATSDLLTGMYAVSPTQSDSYGAFFDFNRGNYWTYAVLPSTIFKDPMTPQSLRVEYTMHY